MLLPNQLASMRLGVSKSWKPSPVVHRFSLDTAPLPGAYSRIISAPRVAGDNATLGDCFPTACTNAVQTFLARQGYTSAIGDSAAVTAYEGMAGYTPLNPATDRGTDPDIGFAWWKSNAIAGYKLASLTQINPQSETDIRQFISKTGGVLLCVELATEQQNERVWTPTGTCGSWGGHAVWTDSYEGALTKITSWGAEFYIDRSYFEASGFVVGAYALELVAA